MTDILDDEPREGHNKPPPSDALERAADLVANANRWRSERPEIANDEQAGNAAEFIEQLRLARDDLERDQKVEVEPYESIISSIKLKYKDPRTLVQLALESMQRLATGWLDLVKARQRLQQQDRDRAAAEAVEKARKAIEDAGSVGTVESELAARRATEAAQAAMKAADKPIERAQIRGDLAGRAMSMRTTWSAKIVNETDALRSYARHPKIREAALIAVRRQANKDARDLKDVTKAPKGIEFVPTETAV
jgi:hypothetical protein